MVEDLPKRRVVEIKIRRATPHDFVNIMRLGEAMLKEDAASIPYPNVDPMKAMTLIMDCKRHGEILVADCSRQIVGAIGLLTREWPWSFERFIVNEFFHVMPKFRKQGTAAALVKAAETFANGAGIPLFIGFSGAKNADVKDRLMQMKGYTYCGGTFFKMPE